MIFVQDDASSHSAKTTIAYLIPTYQRKGFKDTKLIELASVTPDINLIKMSGQPLK